LDRWVARLIDYDRAIRSYEFLKLTPPRMAAELQRRQEEFSRLMATVEGLRDRVSQELGLDRVNEELRGHADQKQALIDQIGRQQAEIAALRAEHQQLEAGLGRFHEEALQQLQQILSDTRQEVLDREAERTTTRADDQLVAELAAMTADLQRLRPEAEACDRQLQAAEAVREEMVVALRRFDDNSWSRPDVSFQSTLDLEGLVRGLSTGSLNRHEASQRLQRTVQIEKSVMEQTAEGALAVAMAPETRVLAQALLEVAGAVLQASATRSVQRRSSSSGWTGGGGSSGSSGGGGGFSSGAGF
jgi:chromosome segregation ATPase